jgi:hypothetical protein
VGDRGAERLGWQQATVPFVRKNAEGKVELYFQLASQSDTSPSVRPRTGHRSQRDDLADRYGHLARRQPG